MGAKPTGSRKPEAGSVLVIADHHGATDGGEVLASRSPEELQVR